MHCAVELYVQSTGAAMQSEFLCFSSPAFIPLPFPFMSLLLFFSLCLTHSILREELYVRLLCPCVIPLYGNGEFIQLPFGCSSVKKLEVSCEMVDLLSFLLFLHFSFSTLILKICIYLLIIQSFIQPLQFVFLSTYFADDKPFDSSKTKLSD